MKYATVCSGIEAPTVAWHPLGWEPVFFSEIEPFPSAVLKHHYPDVPNLGDMTKYKEWADYELDLICGGTPCQSFSVAGLRKGLADPRGNLALVYLAIVDRYRPRWIVWENVPGVLSSNGGRDLGAFLGGLGQLGYHAAWRVLDAQHFGVPQRRRRVFVVGHSGDWRRAAAVFFELSSMRGDTPPSREKGTAVATLTACGVGTCGADDSMIAHTLRAEGHDASEDGTGRGVPLVLARGQGEVSVGRSPALTCGHEVPIMIQDCRGIEKGQNGLGISADGVAYTVTARGGQGVAFDCKAGGNTGLAIGDMAGALRGDGHGGGHAAVMNGTIVRRLTPRECERLQGVPDDYTLINYRGRLAADGPRYKALGNSMAVPVVRWIGRRIMEAECE